MTPADLSGALDFLRRAGRLKDTPRNAWTTAGKPESAAEHTWRLCLFAVTFAPEFPGIDIGKLLKICVVHDLGEAIGGDIPAVDQVNFPNKAVKEREDLLELLRPLPARSRDEIVALWDEYEAAATPEAKLAKALDKLETILTHNQGQNPPGFDYAFNLHYGAQYTAGPDIVAAIRAELDAETQRRAVSDGGPVPP